MDLVQARVWCHICESEQRATRDAVTREYFCSTCHENFVEELNQDGLQDFLAGTATPPAGSSREDIPLSAASSPSMSSSSSESGPDSILRMIDEQPLRQAQPLQPLEQPLQNQSQLLAQTFFESMVNSIAPALLAPRQDPPSRPVGFFVRQLDIGNPSTMFASGIMGLINALSGARPQAHYFEDPNALSNADFERLLHHILVNESSHAGAPPASEELMNSLERVTMSPESFETAKGECSISQEAFVIGDVIVSLPCGHRYKEEPILHWLRMHSTCPVCRVNLTEDQPACGPER